MLARKIKSQKNQYSEREARPEKMMYFWKQTRTAA